MNGLQCLVADVNSVERFPDLVGMDLHECLLAGVNNCDHLLELAIVVDCLDGLLSGVNNGDCLLVAVFGVECPQGLLTGAYKAYCLLELAIVVVECLEGLLAGTADDVNSLSVFWLLQITVPVYLSLGSSVWAAIRAGLLGGANNGACWLELAVLGEEYLEGLLAGAGGDVNSLECLQVQAGANNGSYLLELAIVGVDRIEELLQLVGVNTQDRLPYQLDGMDSIACLVAAVNSLGCLL